jgi:hypothetical protein
MVNIVYVPKCIGNFMVPKEAKFQARGLKPICVEVREFCVPYSATNYPVGSDPDSTVVTPDIEKCY